MGKAKENLIQKIFTYNDFFSFSFKIYTVKILENITLSKKYYTNIAIYTKYHLVHKKAKLTDGIISSEND